MAGRFEAVKCFLAGLCAAVTLTLVGGGCSPQQYKAKADKEVYQIVNNKWSDSLGTKANYVVNDVPPAPNDVQIENKVPPSGIINLAQAVAMATAHNRSYQRQKENLYLSALDLTLVRHDFARRWFGTVDGSYQRGSEDEQVGQESTVGFNQLLAGGARIGASLAVDWGRFLTGSRRTSLASLLSANVSQPLLRGSGRKIVEEKLTQAERNVLYELRSFNRFRKTFVVSLVNDYYRVLQKRNEVVNARNNYQRVLESQQRLAEEAEVGRKPWFEVDQARQNVLKSQDSYVRAEQSYQQQLDQFKIRMALPTDVNVQLDQNELKSLEESGLGEVDFTLDLAVESALVQRLDLANSRDSIDDALRKVMVAADGLGADLNLIGSTAVPSTEDTRWARLQFHRGNYSVGLEGSLPLDRKAERNAYREALISLQQRQRQYQNSLDEVKLDVRQAYRQLREASERYRIQKNSLELARRRVESTTLLLDEGRAKTRDLLEAQDALLLAENNVTAALVDHLIARLSFFRDIGILEVRPDGMWDQETEWSQIKSKTKTY